MGGGNLSKYIYTNI